MAVDIKPMTLGFPKSVPETEFKELATEDLGLPFQQRHSRLLHSMEDEACSWGLQVSLSGKMTGK